MNEYLFLFTIGPVQSFIAQARKTSDLYAASFLLSHLCRIAAEKIGELTKAEPIFPKIDNPSIPNRFIMRVKYHGDLQMLGRMIENEVYDELLRIGTAILEKMGLKKPYHFDEQLKHYFSVNWIFVPFSKEGYEQTYDEIERLLGAIKQVRQFEQFPEIGRKCSLDGQYNALFYKPRPDGSKPNYIDMEGEPAKIQDNYRIQPGEGLSTVGFLKRFLSDAEEKIPFATNISSNFPSTARIALLHILDRFENLPDLVEKSSFKTYREIFGKQFNDQMYFEENLTPGYFKKQGYGNLIDLIPSLKEKLRKIREYVEDQGYKFTSYYALLVFDGDDMGEWLAGKFNKSDGNSVLESFHQTLSEALGDFARYSHDYLKTPLGKAVYAGGDDFLGFVNLTHLFKVIKTLREEFSKRINLSQFSENGKQMTFSAGVVVAHYKTPLSEVLKWVRNMEKEAKSIEGKDAFAISVLKHSGEIHKTVWKWKTDDNQWIPDIIGSIAKRINIGEFSNTFIKALNIELLSLADANKKILFGEIETGQLLRWEVKRLVERSWMGKNKYEKSGAALELYRKEQINRLTDELSLLFALSQYWLPLHFVDNFLSALHIADFLNREVKYVD